MDEEAFRNALARALKRLQTSDRFESEVRAALHRYDLDVVERVVEYLRRHRLLDDARTTENAVETNVGRRAVGDALLVDRLVARGADESLVAEVLQEAEPEAARIDAILRAKYQPTDDPAKAGRFLYGRGFSEEAIGAALEAYFERREPPEEW
jgi:SOS response regulatory protein OraA/RecX